MMAPSTCGFSVCQAISSVLVTVMKSAPRNTRATPGSANSAPASGLRPAASGEAKSAVPLPITSRPGRNFRVAGLGVGSVSMNMRPASCDRRSEEYTGPQRSGHYRYIGASARLGKGRGRASRASAASILGTASRPGRGAPARAPDWTRRRPAWRQRGKGGRQTDPNRLI